MGGNIGNYHQKAGYARDLLLLLLLLLLLSFFFFFSSSTTALSVWPWLP
jgi:hypothetical protein